MKKWTRNALLILPILAVTLLSLFSLLPRHSLLAAGGGEQSSLWRDGQPVTNSLTAEAGVRVGLLPFLTRAKVASAPESGFGPWGAIQVEHPRAHRGDVVRDKSSLMSEVREISVLPDNSDHRIGKTLNADSQVSVYASVPAEAYRNDNPDSIDVVEDVYHQIDASEDEIVPENDDHAGSGHGDEPGHEDEDSDEEGSDHERDNRGSGNDQDDDDEDDGDEEADEDEEDGDEEREEKDSDDEEPGE